MYLKYCIVFFGLCLSSTTYAQDSTLRSFQQKIVSPYENYFNQPRERVYMHFNRSEYLAGESIWFKAYIYEAKAKLPMLETNKLYTELFDQDGRLIERKILFVSNGVANSYFKLNEKLKNGVYTIRSYTNWMRNFQDTYNREFKVLSLGSSATAASLPREVLKEPDLQVFPEGGMFVEGVNNHFGIKFTLPNGKGTKVSGYVLSPKNDTLQTFTTSHLGIGDFTITAAQKVKYRVVIKHDGKVNELAIPEPVENGIGLTVNSLFPTKVIIGINSNPKTVAMLHENNILIMIHNNGKVFKSSYVKVKESGLVTVAKSILDPGVNYITIFGPGFQPLAERVIFNNTESRRGNLATSHSLQSDSLRVDFLTTDPLNKPNPASLSISVLPANTVGNDFSNSLFSDLMLNVIRGSIEDPNYYLENNDLQRQKDLDNLLLTQGWRGYNWPGILSGKPPEEKFPFESGFTIHTTSKNLFKGKPEKNSKLSLFSPQNSLILSSEVDDQGKASFNELYLRDSTHVIISATNLKGSGSNRNLIASIEEQKLDSTIAPPKSKFGINNSTDGFNKPLTPGIIELNEVVITGKKVVNPFANNIYSSAGDQFHLITKENYNQYSSMESLLQSKFFLRVTRGQFGELSVDMGRGQRSMLGSNTPSLIIDGSVMPDLSLLGMISLSDVEAISVNKTGAGISNGGNGSISIITRRRPLDFGDAEYKSTRTMLVNGFANPAAFYTPKYILSPDTETYQRFASIYWKADIITDQAGIAQISFPVPKEITEFTVRIEGMSINGTVYYDNKKISTKTGL